MEAEILDNIVILKVNFNFGYGEDTIYPVILDALKKVGHPISE